jgi:uncharacterized protein (TIGR02680 family)
MEAAAGNCAVRTRSTAGQRTRRIVVINETQSGLTSPVLQFPVPSSLRWQLLRAGLQNIWEYDDQRFVFHHGRLLLRGANESGKTKAVEVLLPFLLDADLSPQRLDPFGSMSRPMRWNLINENNPDVTVNVGYVWLEFGRCIGDSAEFLTIGAGLRAKRSTTDVDTWYFVTTQRVDVGLRLVDGGRVPLVRARLEDANGDAGSVFQTKNDYRRAVNQQLFRMPDEQYSALIEALLQLRRPQLSRQLEPRELSQILTTSLPPLERQVIGSLAEGFERLDRHSAVREHYKRSLEAVQGFLAVYRRYATAVAKGKAQEVTKAESAYQRTRAGLRAKQEEHESAKTLQSDLAEKIASLKHEEVFLNERIQTLKSSDAYKSIEQLEHAATRAREHAEHAEKSKRRLAGEIEQLREAERNLGSAEQGVREQRERLGAANSNARDRAEEVALQNPHRSIEAQLESQALDAAGGTLSSILDERDKSIAALSSHTERVESAEREAKRAEERFRDAEERVRGAQATVSEAEHDATTAREQYATDVSAWLDALEVLKLASVARNSLLDLPAEEMRSIAEQEAGNVRSDLDRQAAETETALNELVRRIGEKNAERNDLAQATHLPPRAPEWRPPRPEGRPGAPFYLLCDFRIEDPSLQANIEAALEAAGLMDAWITPEGVVLDRDTFDVLLNPDPQAGASLADVLVPTEAGGVSRAVIERILTTIGLVMGAESPTEPKCWVAGDGRWRVGPLQGTWRKDVPAFIGASARERARERRLAELDSNLREFDVQKSQLRGELDSVRARRRRLQEGLDRFPNLQPVFSAQARVEAAQRQFSEERAQQEDARGAHQRSQAALDDALAARNAAASKVGLAAWVNTLNDLQDRTYRYRQAASAWLQEARVLWSRNVLLDERRRALEQAQHRVGVARTDAEDAGIRLRKSEAYAAALKEASESSRDELLAVLGAAQERYSAVRGELDQNEKDKSAADQLVGETSGAVTAAQKDAATTDSQRTDAEARFKEFARRDFLSVAEIDVVGTPDTWKYTDTLRIARGADAATDAVDCSAEARDRAENRVVERHQDLTRSLPPEVRLHSERVEGLLEYKSTFNGNSLGLLQLASELDAEVSSRDRLLGEEERELFESFLSGETHQHLRDRLRDAHELVDRMNAQLEAHPSASGMQLRLRWEVTREAPTGTGEAIDLLLRSGHLLSDTDRGALKEFLQQRLKDARTEAGLGTLQERMLAVLDYRTWYSFDIEFRAAGGNWQRLTRKAHGAGSGGQKAVMLHQPLFAAAAAFYESAAPTAPRLMVLDEAFAGIDRETRGHLMGLLAEFDLDFVMTSYEDWGFYEELDGLSTYHLAREKGVRGVYTDWFLWDGKQAQEMGAG